MEEKSHILVVDDVPALAKIAGKALERTGLYQVSYAHSGTTALDQVASLLPDLILLDVDMPEMGGYAVCEQLKQDPLYRDIPVIFLSMMDSTDDMVTGFKVGGADYIIKPFVPSILLARVATHLNLFISKRREQQVRQFLEDILGSMDEGLVVIDAYHIVRQVNPKLEELIGLNGAEIVGRPFSSLFADQSETGIEESDRVLLHSSGERIPVRLLSASLSSDQNSGSRVLLLHDIRELLSAESQRQASRAKDEFLASMSHEMRTPLAAIIGNSELLMESAQGEREQQLLRRIEVSGRQQLAKIRDVLEVSRIEQGAVEVLEEPFDLSSLVADLQYLYSIQAEEKGLVLQVVQQDLPEFPLLGDPEHLQQVLHNLLDNAIKFTEKGAVSLTVWCSEQQVHFRVQDSGIGIEPEVMEKLFERFHQADSSISRGFGGSGLGLYIADNLAVLMGGSIEVSSEPGQGAAFQFNLPYAKDEEKLGTLSEAAQATRFRGRVLIAEDTPEMWMLVESLLQSMGIVTEVAKNGQEAMEMALGNSFDLILMDMQMPVMDGIEATEILRQVGYTQPISALTANIMPEHRRRFEEAGCDAFLTKPVDRQALLQVLRRYLEPAAEGDEMDADEDAIVISDEIREIFMERLATMRPALATALRVEQWDEVRTVAHNIKGSGATFGYPELSEMGKTVCTAIDQEQLAQLPELAQQLIEGIDAALTQ